MSECVNLYQGALWEQAKPLIQRAGPAGLTDDQLLQLIAVATGDATVTASERQLLQALGDVNNVRRIQSALASGEDMARFDPAQLQFTTPRTGAIDRHLAAGTAGAQVGGAYTPEALDQAALHGQRAQATLVGGLSIDPLMSGDSAAPGVKDLSTPAGRDGILTDFGQLMGTQSLGWQACGAASLVALAVHGGAESLKALVDVVVSQYSAGDPTLTRLANELAAPPPVFSLRDLAMLQDELLLFLQDRQDSADRAAGRPVAEDASGLRTQTIERFLRDFAAQLGSLSRHGTVLPIDNSGDGGLDHFVALLNRADGSKAIYEPWVRSDGRHLITDRSTVALYQQARAVH